MFTQPEVLKQSQLIDRLVLDRQTAEEVGRVAQLLLDPQAHRVVGLICKSGFVGIKKKSFTWTQVESIGTDSIMLSGSQEETDLEKIESLDSLIDSEIWTDAGNKIGKLVDYLLEPESGRVLNYLFSSNGLHGLPEGRYTLPPVGISSIGSKRIIVLDTVAQNSQPYLEEGKKKVNPAAEYIKEDLEKTRNDLEAFKQGAQNVFGQVKDRTQAAREQVQEQVSDVRTKLQRNAQPADSNVAEVKSDSESTTPSNDTSDDR